MKKIEKICYNTIRELGREIVYNFNYGEQLTSKQRDYVINNCSTYEDIEEYFYNDIRTIDLSLKEYEEDELYNYYFEIVRACEKENIKVGYIAKNKIMDILVEELQFIYNVKKLAKQSGLDFDEVE